jgi:SAM-dependent methyltransferase
MPIWMHCERVLKTQTLVAIIAMNNPKEIVKKGYDSLSVNYREHFNESHNENYKKWVQTLLDLLPNNPSILELGCGDGIPIAQLISKNCKYFGVDISPVQIENAQKNVRNVIFMVKDMTSLTYPANSFDGIIALYSIIHIPLDEQYGLLQKIFQWLQPNGFFLCTVGAKKWTGTEDDWILKDITMYWSHADTVTYSDWFEKIGFGNLEIEFIPENDGGHTLFLLKKNGN